MGVKALHLAGRRTGQIHVPEIASELDASRHILLETGGHVAIRYAQVLWKSVMEDCVERSDREAGEGNYCGHVATIEQVHPQVVGHPHHVWRDTRFKSG